jgi:hypothetical protein
MERSQTFRIDYSITFFVVQFCTGQIWKQEVVADTLYKGTDFTVE